MDQTITNQQGDLTAARHSSIAMRAYELWMERGCPIGSPEIDWIRAEAEIEQLIEPVPDAAERQAA
jgi:hypothetical protein